MGSQPEVVLALLCPAAGAVVHLAAALSSQLGLQLVRQPLLAVQPLLQALVEGGLTNHAERWVPDLLGHLQWD